MYRIRTNFWGMFLRDVIFEVFAVNWPSAKFSSWKFHWRTSTCMNQRAGYLLILKNKIVKMLDLWLPRNLHALKICTYTVSLQLNCSILYCIIILRETNKHNKCKFWSITIQVCNIIYNWRYVLIVIINFLYNTTCVMKCFKIFPLKN